MTERKSQSTGEIIIGGIKALYEFFIGDLFRVFSIFKEINNYIYVGKQLRKMKKKAEWKKLKLHKAYFNVMYTVINLPPEVYESEEQYWQVYVIEILKPTNDWLASWNLQDVVSLRVKNKVDKDKGYYFYLVKYVPMFTDLSIGWMIKWGLISCITWWAQVKWDIFAKFGTLLHHLVLFLHT